ncbi:MAG TPA: RecQ family ATP-dependent DNA helicase [Gammaproteobacteria bacterium]|jgi:ATP-dependent DNA helicase RecQ|nr:RecQ family ATP-dependent DNA helicase [Gammaproteobacteria bacterium]
MQKNIADELLSTLVNQFHLTSFREGQMDALMTLMTKGRLLCIQPTGYGKSLLYQLPSVLLDGITLVISPLLALMRDQLNQLKYRFNIPAASWNTDQTAEENRNAREAARKGKIKILFIAPEQLTFQDRLTFILSLPIKLLVVDEAHCISTWGHDFRPSYRQITKLIKAIIKKNSDIKLLALTATANKKTEEDIKNQFKIQRKTLTVQRESMQRKNIRLTVIQTQGVEYKLATLTHLFQFLKGCGLIYCATRENTERVAEFLNDQGIKAAAYHAGIPIQHKLSIQNDFLADRYPVIAATNALGMGIDKPNLRYVIHFDFPGSITAYYQEMGRAGRDGQPAEGILIYDRADRRIQRFFIESLPKPEDFADVLFSINREDEGANMHTLKSSTGMHSTKLSLILAELEEQAFLKKIYFQGMQIFQKTKKKGEPDLSRYHTQYHVKLKELDAIQYYAEQSQYCLMEILQQALGDKNTSPCKQCSQCEASPFFNEALSSMTVPELIP